VPFNVLIQELYSKRVGVAVTGS